jgi:hypothetical protein
MEAYRMDKADEMGLVEVYAYHCRRCNYTWLPRDFDYNWREPFEEEKSKWLWWGQDLFFREPPKSCARCKSRSWNIHFPLRKLRLNPVLKAAGQEWMIKQQQDYPWVGNIARLRALARQADKDELSPRDIL